MTLNSPSSIWTLVCVERGERRRLLTSTVLGCGAAVSAIALLAVSGYLISRAAQRPQILALMVAIVAVRTLGIARATLRYSERLVSHDLALRQLTRLRTRFYRRLVPLVPGGLPRRAGDLLNRFVSDVDTLQDLHPRSIIPICVALLVTVLSAIAAWVMLDAAGVVVLICMTATSTCLFFGTLVLVARSQRRQAPARAQLSSALVQSIDGASELALAGRSHQQAALLRAGDAHLKRLARRDAWESFAARLLGGSLAGGALIWLLCVTIAATHTGALPGVMLAAVVFLLLGAMESAVALPSAARTWQACATADARLDELRSTAPAVSDPEAPQLSSGAGELALDDVSFRYDKREPWVLAGLHLRVAAGEHIAIVGPSGCGKSTLAEILARFIDPQRGAVRIDGVDVRRCSGEHVRSRVLLCDQQAHLFNTTVAENLLLADRKASPQRLLAALRSVELERWARALPQGLDTFVGQSGELISGGQRQRLALARALLSPASVLVLDEPTAHLDAAQGRRVMMRLIERRHGRSLIVITHDRDAVDRFERVLELNGGRLLELS